MNIGCEIAYRAGKSSYHNGGNWSTPPEGYTDIEQNLWQEGFDQALQEDLGMLGANELSEL